MDKKIFDIVYGLAQKNRHLGSICDFAAKVSSLLFFALYSCVLLLLIHERNEKILLYVVVPLSALVVNIALRKIVKRPRPLNPEELGSFPSNHSTSAGIIAFACLYVNTPFGSVVIFLALLTGILRVLAGRHYVTDVLCGFLISAAFSTLFRIG